MISSYKPDKLAVSMTSLDLCTLGRQENVDTGFNHLTVHDTKPVQMRYARPTASYHLQRENINTKFRQSLARWGGMSQYRKLAMPSPAATAEQGMSWWIIARPELRTNCPLKMIKCLKWWDSFLVIISGFCHSSHSSSSDFIRSLRDLTAKVEVFLNHTLPQNTSTLCVRRSDRLITTSSFWVIIGLLDTGFTVFPLGKYSALSSLKHLHLQPWIFYDFIIFHKCGLYTVQFEWWVGIFCFCGGWEPYTI